MQDHELVLTEPFVGSPNSKKVLACQFLKDTDVVLKNGIIKAEDALFVIQNYSNLTLDNVTIIGSEKNTYLLSNNYGNIILRNGTKLITAPGSKTVAFDLYYGLLPEYDGGVTLTIEDHSVIIDGPIEYGKAARASQEGLIANCRLTVPFGYMLEAPAGYEWVDNGNGTQTLKLITT
jgi:hypothetical protein